MREAADQVRKEVKHIDCLINNAAIMACPEAKSQDGFELQLATNYLAHFVLTNALMDLVSVDGKMPIQDFRVLYSKRLAPTEVSEVTIALTQTL